MKINNLQKLVNVILFSIIRMSLLIWGLLKNNYASSIFIFDRHLHESDF